MTNDTNPTPLDDAELDRVAAKEAARERHTLPVLGNTLAEPCGSCGARCCKTFPGIPSPADFGAPDADAVRAKVRELLATGKWIIDHDGSESRIEHEPANWYIRPRMTHDRRDAVNSIAWMGEGTCVFLVEDRCSIYADRPAGCRELVPGAVAGECRAPKAKVDAVDEWEPYEGILLNEGWAAEEDDDHD